MKMQGQHKKLFLGSLRASRAIKNKQKKLVASELKINELEDKYKI